MESPPAEVLAWAEGYLRSAVVTAQAMTGGIDAQMFRLSIADSSAVVLRVTEADHHEQIDYHVRVLDVLAPTEVPAPEHLAHASGLGPGGHTAMLMSMLPGDPTLPVEPDDAWLGQLVRTVMLV